MVRCEHFLHENWKIFQQVSLLKENKHIEDTFPKTNSKRPCKNDGFILVWGRVNLNLALSKECWALYIEMLLKGTRRIEGQSCCNFVVGHAVSVGFHHPPWSLTARPWKLQFQYQRIVFQTTIFRYLFSLPWCLLVCLVGLLWPPNHHQFTSFFVILETHDNREPQNIHL